MTYKQTILGAAYRLVYSYRPFTVVSEGGKTRRIYEAGTVLDEEMTMRLIGDLNLCDPIRAIRFN